MKLCVLCETITSKVALVDNYYLCLDSKACAERTTDLVFGALA